MFWGRVAINTLTVAFGTFNSNPAFVVTIVTLSFGFEDFICSTSYREKCVRTAEYALKATIYCASFQRM